MKFKNISWVLLIVSFLFFSACTNSSTNSSELVEFDEIEDDNSIVNLISTEEGTTENDRSYNDLDEPLEDIYPLHWGRQITTRIEETIVEFEDDNHASVTQNLTIEGILHILTEDSTHIEKPFLDHGVRYFELERNAPGNGFRGWHITERSGTEFWSDNDAVNIQQVNIQFGNADTTITDILQLIPRDLILNLPAETEITLTVTTDNVDDQLFLYRRFLHRKPFLNNNDGTYTVTFITPHLPIHFRFGIDAISYETLFTDEEIYADNGWGIPAKIIW